MNPYLKRSEPFCILKKLKESVLNFLAISPGERRKTNEAPGAYEMASANKDSPKLPDRPMLKGYPSQMVPKFSRLSFCDFPRSTLFYEFGNLAGCLSESFFLFFRRFT